MPLFTSLDLYDLIIYVQFHIGVDDAEYIIEDVSVGASTDNILDVLSVEVIEKIEKHIGENLDKIISYNDDGGVY